MARRRSNDGTWVYVAPRPDAPHSRRRATERRADRMPEKREGANRAAGPWPYRQDRTDKTTKTEQQLQQD